MKKFIENRYHLHMLYGVALGLIIYASLYFIGAFEKEGWIYNSLILGFIIFVGTWVRESYFKVRQAPFDWWDILWSAFGAIIGGLFTQLLLNLLNL